MDKEAKRLFWNIFDLEHQLGIAEHSDGYNCMECWRQEDQGIFVRYNGQ